MKNILCLLNFHKWKYNKDESERTCTKCAKKQLYDYDEVDLSGFQGGLYWVTVKKPKHS